MFIMRKVLIRIIFLYLVICLSGCGNGGKFYNQKADDAFSEYIYSKMKHSVYYLGKEECGNITYYEYAFSQVDANILETFGNSLNMALEKEKRMISVIVSGWIPGGSEQLFKLSNYTDKETSTADFNEFNHLEAYYPDFSENDFFQDPKIYASLKDIIIFSAEEELLERAKEEQVDWYALWPNLELIENFE